MSSYADLFRMRPFASDGKSPNPRGYTSCTDRGDPIPPGDEIVRPTSGVMGHGEQKDVSNATFI